MHISSKEVPSKIDRKKTLIPLSRNTGYVLESNVKIATKANVK